MTTRKQRKVERLQAALNEAASNLVTISNLSNEPKIVTLALAYARMATDARGPAPETNTIGGN